MNRGDLLAQQERTKQFIENHAITEKKEIVQKIFKKFGSAGLSTGYPTLDSIVNGLRSEECIILGGDTGMGKSAFMVNIMSNLAKENIVSCYIDLENGETTSYMRLLGIYFDKPTFWFADDRNIDEAIKMKEEIDLKMIYYGREDLDHINFQANPIHTLSKIIELEADRGIKVFIVDPLQAIEGFSDKDNLAIQGKFVETMKNIALQKQVTVFILHHLRKSNYSGTKSLSADELNSETKSFYRKPVIEDFKGSSKITEFATQVWGIVRAKNDPELSKRSTFWVVVLKNRNGRLGETTLVFNENTLTIKEKVVTEKYRDFTKDLEPLTI